MIYASSTNAGQDGRTMRMVCIPGYALPVLIHGIWNESTSSMDDSCVLVYVGETWLDVSSLFDETEEPDKGIVAQIEGIIDRFISHLDEISGLDDVLRLLFFRIQGGERNTLPNTGLDAAQPIMMSIPMGEDPGERPQPKKSRPKTAE